MAGRSRDLVITDVKLDIALWPSRRCKHCKRWATRWHDVCAKHGAKLQSNITAARRRQWAAYLAVMPFSLDEAKRLMSDPTISVQARSKLIMTVLANLPVAIAEDIPISKGDGTPAKSGNQLDIVALEALITDEEKRYNELGELIKEHNRLLVEKMRES